MRHARTLQLALVDLQLSQRDDSAYAANDDPAVSGGGVHVGFGMYDASVSLAAREPTRARGLLISQLVLSVCIAAPRAHPPYPLAISPLTPETVLKPS